MKKHFFLCLGLIILLWGCQASENKYPAKSFQVLGWTSNDQKLILKYSNLKADLPEGRPSPTPSERQYFLYTYDVKNKVLAQEVNLSLQHLHESESLNGMGYLHQLNHVYYESEDEKHSVSRLHRYDLNQDHDQVLLTNPQAITSFRNIEISPDGRYAYTYNNDQYVYDLITGQQVKWQMPLDTDFLYWFETKGRTRFATQQGIFELLDSPRQIRQVQELNLQEQVPEYRILSNIEEATYLYAIFRRNQNPSIVTIASSGVWQNEKTVTQVKATDIAPEYLSHDHTRLAYIKNHQLVILNLKNMNEQIVLTLDKFPDGGLQTAPWMPSDGFRW